MIYSDIPTRSQIEVLLAHRSAASVSIYLPTNRLSHQARADRIVLANLTRTATDQLEDHGVDPDEIESVADGIAAIIDDDEFWTRQCDSLAVFATPAGVGSFRLPNRLGELVRVSDRFHVKPLLRAVTFPHAAYVLALARGSVRFLEIGPDGPPEEIRLDELPRDAWDPRSNRVFKARDRNYVRQIEHALRAVLNGSSLPLILASTERIAALYRSVNTYPNLVDARWPGNPEAATDVELADGARTILDEVYTAELLELEDLFDRRRSEGRTATDVADVAHLATRGAVDTLLVDIDATEPGTVDDRGAVCFAEEPTPDSHGVIDEIVRRVYLLNGRVMAVRADDIPGAGAVAAILRYVP